jgi:hypothetical protein
MTTPDFRALCAELYHVWSRATNPDDLYENLRPLIDRARAALAEPEGEGPSDEELIQLAFARAVLESWGGGKLNV